jgi:hypothetical protein
MALCHNVLPHERRWTDEPMIRALLRRMDAVLVHSQQQASLASARTSAPVKVAALPLHLPATASQGCLPAPRPRRNRLLFFGTVRPYKGLDILLRALAETMPQVSLTVAGEIWYGRNDLHRLISDLHLGDRVTMPDRYVPMDEIPATFATADAVVLPYRSGTASQNALVALQLGLPVIATRAGAIADSITDGVNGLLCPPGDVEALARTISLLYEPGILEHLQLGVRPPQTRQVWRDYVAAVESAVTSASGRHTLGSATPAARKAPTGRPAATSDLSLGPARAGSDPQDDDQHKAQHRNRGWRQHAVPAGARAQGVRYRDPAKADGGEGCADGKPGTEVAVASPRGRHDRGNGADRALRGRQVREQGS